MGRSSKRYSVVNIASCDSKLSKYRKYVSLTSLEDIFSKKERRIKENFRTMIRRLMAKQGQNK